MAENLNELCIETDDGPPMALADNGLTIAGAGVEVCFKNLRERLITEIKKSEYAVGCVAWLTDSEILEALAGLKSVSIIVQKEDLFRPDLGDRTGYKERTRRAYDKLRGNERWSHEFLGGFSYSCDPYLAPVRCVGNYNRDKKPAAPRMHNKFLVLCAEKAPIVGQYDGAGHTPHTVWTGSFNFTWNATRSFENALIIRNAAIASAYYKEWGQIAALSEPLDWESDWCAPEWRQGS